MVYEFNKNVINLGGVNNFNSKYCFIGYILPNGDICRCEKHNVEDVSTILKLFLQLLRDYYDDRDRFLTGETKSKLIKIVINYLRSMSYDQVIALDDFLNSSRRIISDILVQLFGCHLVTRLDKKILTSKNNHEVFYNYLLNDFNVETIDEMVYNNEKKEYCFVSQKDRNGYLYDEIKTIRNDSNDDIALFYK